MNISNGVNKKFLISIIILSVLAAGGFFYLPKTNFSKFNPLAAVASFFSSFNDKETETARLLRESRLELEKLQEENYLLKEKLELEEETRTNLELKYELELENLVIEFKNLAEMIDDFGQQMARLTQVSDMETELSDQEIEEEEESETEELEKEKDVCLVNVNTASKEELQKIIGVGSVIAQRIIDGRPFSSIYNLIRVNGIGEVTLQKIIDQGCAYVENDTGPSISEPISPSGSGTSSLKKEKTCTENSIEINTVSQKELEKLTGVGPDIAEKIIKERLFFTINDLIKVSGIGETKLQNIKNQGCAYVDESLLPPIASFTFFPQTPFVNQEIIFDASFSTSYAGKIISYLWDFGDGNSTSTSLATTTHSFATPGQFLIMILVVDDRQATSSPATTTINVINPPQPILEISTTTLSFRGEEEEIFSSQSIVIENSGEEELNWTASTTVTVDWLSIVPDSGTISAFSSSTIEILVNTFGLSPGSYQATTTIEAPDAQNSPQEISVSLEIFEPAKNLLKNEFFEEWELEDNEPDYWKPAHWIGSTGHSFKNNWFQDADALVGNYSVKIGGGDERILKQIIIEMETNITYFSEVWVKGTGKTRIGIIYPSGYYNYSDWQELQNSAWTKITHSATTSATPGEKGGLAITTIDEGGDDPLTTLYLGAAWLGTAPPPKNWLQI